MNSSEWQPIGEQHGAEFKFLLTLIREEADRVQVTKFMRFEDQKRALLSRLLVRRAATAMLDLASFADVTIGRTKGRKPFLVSPRPPADRPDLANFNFNVSHEGDWVVLASEPLCVCGVDVAAPEQHRPGKHRANIFEDFRDQLTADEWLVVRQEASAAPSDPAEQPGYQAFQRFWSCKEAFVKARGDGLGFELGRAGFDFQALSLGDVSGGDPTGPGEPDPRAFVASVRVDGQPAPGWRFVQHRLGENHWVTVARGPTDSVVDANGEFLATLRRPTADFSAEEWQAELCRESPEFEQLTVAFLVPEISAAEHERAKAAT